MKVSEVQPILRQIALALFAGSLALPVSAQQEAAEEQQQMTPKEELSYALGMDVGKSLKRFGAELDFQMVMDAAETTLKDEEPALSPERASEVKRAFFQERRKKQAEERQAAAEQNLAEGEAFLAENKTKEGVMSTDSGLQYQSIEEGTGPKPEETDRVTVHYKGTLLDGTEFDSSHTRGKPATFPVKGVIAGWTEALQLMPVGSVYKLFIPPELAYGERGRGRIIPPNSTLIFEVELLEIVGDQTEIEAGSGESETQAELEGDVEAESSSADK